MATIASRLREIREADFCLDQRKFAELLRRAGFQTSHSSVGNYEKDSGGTSKVPAEYVAAVCRATGYAPAYVLGLSDEKRPPDPTVAQRAISEIERVIDAMRATSATAGALDATRDATRATEDLPAQDNPSEKRA